MTKQTKKFICLFSLALSFVMLTLTVTGGAKPSGSYIIKEA